jgi:hypothetical protein
VTTLLLLGATEFHMRQADHRPVDHQAETTSAISRPKADSGAR